MIRLGDRVRTLKGRHGTEPSEGIVISEGHHWRRYRAVVVKKDNGQKRLFLEKNLVKIPNGWNWQLIRTMLACIAFWAIIIWAVVSVMTVKANAVSYDQITMLSKVKHEARKYTKYPSTIAAICMVESSAGRDKLGDMDQSLGIMQIRIETVRWLSTMYDKFANVRNMTDQQIELKLLYDYRFSVAVAAYYINHYIAHGWSHKRAVMIYNGGTQNYTYYNKVMEAMKITRLIK